MPKIKHCVKLFYSLVSGAIAFAMRFDYLLKFFMCLVSGTGLAFSQFRFYLT